VADVATLIWNEDFEVNAIGTIFAGGSSGAAIDTVNFKTGAKSVRFNGDPAWGLHSFPGGSAITVFKGWIMLAAIPNGIELMTLNGGPRFGIDLTTKKFGWINGTAQVMDHLSNVTPVAGQWYLLEYRVNQSANPWVIDYQIDGVAQPQITYAVAAGSVNGIYLGHSTGFSAFTTVNYDLVQMSQTAADYPLSAVSISLTAPPAIFTPTSVPPSILFDYAIVAPPATFTPTSVSPTLFIGVANTVVAPPAIFTPSAVTPTPVVSITISAPPATFTGSSVAPLVSGTALVTAPPATFTSTAVAPPVSGSGNVVASVAVTTFTSVAPTPTVSLTRVAPPATFTASSVAPILTQGRVVVAPVGVFTGSSVAPTPILGMLPAAAVWTATALAPGFGRLVAPNAALVTYTSVASAVTFSDLVVAPPAVSTYTAVSGALSLGGSVAPAAALVSFSAVAPILQVSNTLVAPAAVFSSTTIPPVLSGAGAVAVPPATWTATAVSPAIIFNTVVIGAIPILTMATMSPGTGVTIICTLTGLCPNGDFETNTTSWAVAGAGSTITRDTTQAAVGSASLFCATDGTIVTQGCFYNSQTITPAYSAGMKHRVSFWIKAHTPGDVGKQIGIYFRAWLGGSINYTINPSLPPGTLFVLPAAWTYMTFEFAPTLAHDRAEALWRVPGSGVATAFNLDGVVHNVVQLSMTPAPPTLSMALAIQPTPVLASYSSADPTLLVGSGAILTPQAAILTATGVGPFIFLHSFYPAPPALATFTATAPGVTVGSGASVVAPAAAASYAAAAPTVAIPGGVTSPPALLTMSAPIPSLSIGSTVAMSAGISSFSAVSPVINKETIVGAPVAAWLATDSPPSVAMRLDAPAGITTYTSTAPTGGVFQSVVAPVSNVTFLSVAPGISGVSVGTEFTYTQGSIWQHSMTSGDMEQSQTGRIVQTYERL
jgi:hypothetical protein